MRKKTLSHSQNLINDKAARRLWLSVIRLAIEDATQNEKLKLKNSALAYLSGEDSTLAFLAVGCNPDEARQKILMRLSTQALPAAA